MPLSLKPKQGSTLLTHAFKAEQSPLNYTFEVKIEDTTTELRITFSAINNIYLLNLEVSTENLTNSFNGIIYNFIPDDSQTWDLNLDPDNEKITFKPRGENPEQIQEKYTIILGDITLIKDPPTFRIHCKSTTSNNPDGSNPQYDEYTSAEIDKTSKVKIGNFQAKVNGISASNAYPGDPIVLYWEAYNTSQVENLTMHLEWYDNLSKKEYKEDVTSCITTTGKYKYPNTQDKFILMNFNEDQIFTLRFDYTNVTTTDSFNVLQHVIDCKEFKIDNFYSDMTLARYNDPIKLNWEILMSDKDKEKLLSSLTLTDLSKGIESNLGVKDNVYIANMGEQVAIYTLTANYLNNGNKYKVEKECKIGLIPSIISLEVNCELALIKSIFFSYRVTTNTPACSFYCEDKFNKYKFKKLKLPADEFIYEVDDYPCQFVIKAYADDRQSYAPDAYICSLNAESKTIKVGEDPWDVAVGSLGSNYEQVAYVVNHNSNTLSTILLYKDYKQLDPIKLGQGPCRIALGSDDSRYIYVANEGEGSDNIVIIDKYSGSTKGINIGFGVWYIAISKDDKYVFAVDKPNNNLSIIELPNGGLVKNIAVGQNPCGIAISQNNQYAFVSNGGNNNVSVIALDTFNWIKKISVGDWPGAIAVSPDNRFVFVVNENSNDISVISINNLDCIKNIAVGQWPCGIAISLNSKYVCVANRSSNDISIIDISSLDRLKNIYIGDQPCGIAISPDNRYICVTKQRTGEVLIFSSSIEKERYPQQQSNQILLTTESHGINQVLLTESARIQSQKPSIIHNAEIEQLLLEVLQKDKDKGDVAYLNAKNSLENRNEGEASKYFREAKEHYKNILFAYKAGSISDSMHKSKLVDIKKIEQRLTKIKDRKNLLKNVHK